MVVLMGGGCVDAGRACAVNSLAKRTLARSGAWCWWWSSWAAAAAADWWGWREDVEARAAALPEEAADRRCPRRFEVLRLSATATSARSCADW